MTDLEQQDLQEAFRTAASLGDIGAMEKALDAGADVNGFSPKQGHTALVWAANNGHAPAVAFLLLRGAQPDLGTKENEWTPLMVAASQGHKDSVALLLKGGASTAARKNDGRSVIDILRAENKQEMLQFIAAHDPAEVSLFHNVADRVMQEVYSFSLKERITLLRKPAGDVEAIERQPFTGLADKGGLTRAFEEHKKRGGKLSDEEVFNGVLAKTKILPLRKP